MRGLVLAALLSVGRLGLDAASAGAAPADSLAIVAGDSLTVEQCVAAARRQSPAIVAAGFERAEAASDSAAVAVNRRPDFSIVTGVTVAPRGFYDPAITNLGDYELKLGVDWTVADGGRRARARERGSLDVSAAGSRLALESREAGLRAAELAFALLRWSETESVQREALDWLARLETLVRAGVASGARSPADSVRIALERDAAAADLETAALDARTTALELLLLMGRDVDSPIAILDSGETRERAAGEADSIRLMASVPKQPEVALAHAADSAARLDLLEVQHRTAPQVGLALDAGLAGTDLTAAVPADLRDVDPRATFGDRLRRDLGASAAIHLRLPILDAAASRSRSAREAALGASEVRSRAAEIDQRERALSLLARWRSASRQAQAARETSERAASNLLKMKSLYAAGAATLLDLLDARRVYDDARQRLAETRWAERVAQFQVEDRQ